MKLKKVFIGIVGVCIVAVFVIFYTMSNKGWGWRLPQALLDKIDFDQIGENVDRLISDGYTNVGSSDSKDGEPTYYILGRADGENATPMIYVYWENDTDGSAATDTIEYDAHTMFVWNLDSAVGNKDQYRFEQEITIRYGQNRIWMIYYTKNLFSGRQQVIDYLSQFCDHYCPD